MNDLESDGYAIADLALDDDQCEHITASLPVVPAKRGGVRNLMAHPSVVRLLLHESLGRYLRSVIGRDLVAVRATLFDKTAETNWRVHWHQDRAIAVKERMHVPGYGPWSSKAGSLHVEPPAEVLAQMLAVRVHLDVCGSENGPLRVVPGSHRYGKLAEQEVTELVSGAAIVDLYVPQGAIVLMRPLLVHSSSAARAPEHRRVLHIELAPRESISPLQWHTAVRLWHAA
ncbi:MAG TPA: phytanoyl-CoA dioxygenase family protein [Thermoanaerobaculia bacterium]|nr:phytanoyl-CoA dioxygenase family protein [Thermoanaerobaculia bacterium]